MIHKPITEFSGDYRFLSNFYPVMIRCDRDGIKVPGYYPSVEHAYQACKTVELSERVDVMRAVTPAAAKKLGRKVTLRPGWDDLKVEVMHELLRQKFSYLDLGRSLLRTLDAELVEGNWWGDRYWGVCEGKGKNVLGKLLMEVREELRREGTLL